MNRRYGFGVCLTFLLAAHSSGAEFLLTVEEVDGPTPQIKSVKSAPKAEFGWLSVAEGSEPIRIRRSIEFRVTTEKAFYIRMMDRGEQVEVKGTIRTSDQVPAFKPVSFTTLRQPPSNVVEQNEHTVTTDFIVDVEYRISENPYRAVTYVQSEIPLSLKGKFCLGSGLGGSGLGGTGLGGTGLGGTGLGGSGRLPTTLWSLKKVATSGHDE